MRKSLITLLVSISLAGCTQFTVVKKAAREESAKVADEVLDSVKFMLCRGMTVGAWVRAYGSDPEKASAWRALCADGPKEAPAVKLPEFPTR